MKTLKLSKLLVMITISFIFSISNSFAHNTQGNNPAHAVSAATVSKAISKLGYKVVEHDDKKGRPHLVIQDKVSGAKAVAFFMDDCGNAGCEDIIAYAEFDKNDKLNLDTINEWNHIGTMLRSRLSRSKGGEIGLSMPISFLSDKDEYRISMLIGLFIIETKMLSATLDNLK